MKKIKLLILYTALSFGATAQDEFTDRWTSANNLVEQQKFDEALSAFAPLLREQPTYTDTHVQMAWCYMMQGNMDTAMEHGQNAYQIDQLNASVYAINAYLMYAVGNSSSGKIYLDNAVWLTPNDDDLPYFEKDINTMKAAGLEVSELEKEFNAVVSGSASRDKSWSHVMTTFLAGLEKLNAGDYPGSKVTFKEALSKFETAPDAQRLLGPVTSYVIATNYYSVGDSTNYLPLLRAMSGYMGENRKTSVMINLHIATLLGEHLYATGQYAQSFEVLSAGLDYLSQIIKYTYLASYKAMFLNQYSLSAYAVGNTTEAEDAAKLLTELEWSGYDEWYQANAWYLLGQFSAEGSAQARENYQKAHDMAAANGFEDLRDTLAELLK